MLKCCILKYTEDKKVRETKKERDIYTLRERDRGRQTEVLRDTENQINALGHVAGSPCRIVSLVPIFLVCFSRMNIHHPVDSILWDWLLKRIKWVCNGPDVKAKV